MDGIAHVVQVRRATRYWTCATNAGAQVGLLDALSTLRSAQGSSRRAQSLWHRCTVHTSFDAADERGDRTSLGWELQMQREDMARGRAALRNLGSVRGADRGETDPVSTNCSGAQAYSIHMHQGYREDTARTCRSPRPQTQPCGARLHRFCITC